jgi:transposase InsO family protein
MTYRFVSEHRSTFPVKKMCNALRVSRSGFCRWEKRQSSQRTQANRTLLFAIRREYEVSDKTYGAPRITRELREKGMRVGHNRVARLMRQHRIVPQTKRRYTVTTNSRHGFTLAPNLLNRNFHVAAPNRVWVTDITYVKADHGWLYVCVFIDLFSRSIVGWSVSQALDHTLVTDALLCALDRRRPQVGLIIHSDRGIQYACDAFRTLLIKNCFRQSMSRKGDCWDNAVAESFFATLKTELIYRYHFANKLEVERALFKYIEIWYNRFRRHSAIDYKSPETFETNVVCA